MRSYYLLTACALVAARALSDPSFNRPRATHRSLLDASESGQCMSPGGGLAAAAVTRQRLLSDLRACGSHPPPFPVEVGVKIHLYKLLSVEEAAGTIKLTGRLDLYWHDESLSWDPTQYGGIDKVRLAGGAEFWRPRLALRNFADTPWVSHGAHDGERRTDIPTVYSDGSVYDSMQVALEAWCAFDFTELPFDQQTCQLQLESADYACCDADAPAYSDASHACPVRLVPMPRFTASGTAINGTFAAVDLSAFVTHTSWGLLGVGSDWAEESFACAQQDAQSVFASTDRSSAAAAASAASAVITPSEATIVLQLHRWPLRHVLHGFLPVGLLACMAGLASWLDPVERASDRLLLTLAAMLSTACEHRSHPDGTAYGTAYLLLRISLLFVLLLR